MAKRFFLLTCAVLLLTGQLVFAADITVRQNGVSVKQASGINFVGPTVTESGTEAVVTMTALSGNTNLEGNLNVDGTLYVEESTLTVSSVTGQMPMVIAGSYTADPCPTLGAGAIFFDRTAGKPCFCNSLGVDLSLYNGTTACF